MVCTSDFYHSGLKRATFPCHAGNMKERWVSSALYKPWNSEDELIGCFSQCRLRGINSLEVCDTALYVSFSVMFAWEANVEMELMLHARVYVAIHVRLKREGPLSQQGPGSQFSGQWVFVRSCVFHKSSSARFGFRPFLGSRLVFFSFIRASFPVSFFFCFHFSEP